MDFYKIKTRENKGKPNPELYPDFTVGRSKDLMVRGRAFYAIWDEEAGLWSQDEYDVQRLVDKALNEYAMAEEAKSGIVYDVKYLQSFSNNGWSNFQKFVKNLSDNSHELDSTLTFANTEVKKTDYASRRLPYPLEPGPHDAWDELIGTLYNTEEREKLEWAIGAVVSGDSKKIQKFWVLYGPAGTGKSTILNIIQQLFEGYTTTFDGKALGSSGQAFSTEVFRNNPLVALQHDGDLSKIEDNTRLNSIISHEDMVMNEKYKAGYTSKVNAILFMGSNQPVKISDAKSGIIRRLIDVHPTGVKIPANHYNTLINQVTFELGAIAQHCLDVYRELGKNHYNGYRPLEMMLQTDVFFNFIEANFDLFKEQDSVTLRHAYLLYKEFCQDTGIDRILPQYKVREELRNYFDEFKDRAVLNGEQMRSVYVGFNANKFKAPKKDDVAFSLVMEETESILDDILEGQLAQYSKLGPDGSEIPEMYWSKVRTSLRDLNTHEVHFVKVPPNHIVIDFDLKDINGDKSLERNLEAASLWPATYAELSKGGSGVHLHYLFDGDVSELAPVFSEGIEVKVYTGDASLRRRVSKCNNVPIARINSGLPLKEKKVLTEQTIRSEQGLRALIARNLRKEIHPNTKTSVDFIHKILDDAYAQGLTYDVTDLKPKIIAFASASTHQPLQSLKTVQSMKWRGTGENVVQQVEEYLSMMGTSKDEDGRLVFWDLEVYPNLFAVGWIYEDAPDDSVVVMLNPTPQEMEQLFKMKLVGYNCRRYDNHIAYARFMGYSIEKLYELSQKIIVDKNPNALFASAYSISYTDIFDYSSKKQSLKKFQIDLGITHKEMDLPWDEPVPDDRVDDVIEYLKNDVLSTRATHNSRKQDWNARLLLAELSGLTPNHTTQQHTAKIIFGEDRRPQTSFVYTDLSKEFHGYTYDRGTSTYRGEVTGEGGYVYAEPGIYRDVVVLDVASMHPTSIENLNAFGPYTKNFSALLQARLAIKHKDYARAKGLLDGKLAPYLGDPADAKALSYALKIIINIVYGLTSAKFDNPFRDPRNKDNIVAKRGALFMIDLKHYVQEVLGKQVVHIKTDSIKIPGATSADIEAVMEFGRNYGYTFEHEFTYSKMALVNDAVYIAQYGWHAEEPEKVGTWDATGAQFAHPVVFKTLFSDEPITFEDYAETKQVTQGVMYLDFDNVDKPMFSADKTLHHVGRTGRFVPVLEGCGGGILVRVKDEKAYAVTGTKGYLWVEADIALSDSTVELDMSYYQNLINEAVKTIDKFGNFEEFINDPA